MYIWSLKTNNIVYITATVIASMLKVIKTRAGREYDTGLGCIMYNPIYLKGINHMGECFAVHLYTVFRAPSISSWFSPIVHPSLWLIEREFQQQDTNKMNEHILKVFLEALLCWKAVVVSDSVAVFLKDTVNVKCLLEKNMLNTKF